MAFSTAQALLRKVRQSFHVSVATVSGATYAPDGTPTAITVDGTAAASQISVFRGPGGRIHTLRVDASGVPIGNPRSCESAEQLFETIFEGLQATPIEVGDAAL